jgi:hypothetical protein
MGSAAYRNGAADQDSLVGVPWYTADTYRAILDVMEDSGLFPESFAAWHRGAEERVRCLSLAGRMPVPVRVDPQEFLHWCAKERLRPDAESRMEYARVTIVTLQEHPSLDSVIIDPR